MKVSTSTMIALSALVILIGCDGTAPNGDDPISGELDMALSELDRDLEPDITDDEALQLHRDNRAFAWELYHQVTTELDGENLFISPFSISTALAMTYAGAAGETKQQMSDTLHFALPDDDLHAGFNDLDLELAARNHEATERFDPMTLRVNNHVWGHEDPSKLPLDSFLDTLAVNYGTGVYLLDYSSDPDGARDTINAAVSEWTEDKIEELIPEGVINALTTLVLTNTIYMLAPWTTPFEESRTAPASFTTNAGDEIQVETMEGEINGRYGAGEGFEALALPYHEGELEMVILLPDAGSFESFEGGLDQVAVDTMISSLDSTLMRVRLPRFTLRTPISLKPALSEMGMPLAFSQGGADFSNMGPHQVYIGEVIHEAFVEVDEAGTEAAAATAVIMQDESEPMIDVEVFVDRSFLFMIRDVPTDTILFVGRVLDPSA